MRKLVLFIACSLDGYIARENGDVDWLFTDQDYGYAEFLSGIDTVLMGRKTYEQVLTFGEYPYKGIEGYVFSRTRGNVKDENAAFVSGDVADFVQDLKRRPGKAIWLVGGAQLVAECVKHDLVDEFIISVHPVILGRGVPLFLPGLPEQKLELFGSERFSSGLVQLSYRRAR
jgi:dihydrofolate reductase